jgi:hypothetical protein
VSLTIVSATISANTDNWNPTGLSTASALRATLTASWNLTGIVAPSDDRLMILDNIGGGTLTLKHNTTSTSQNCFLCPGDTDMTLPPDGWTWLQYDFTSSRWRVLGTGASIPSGTYALAIEGGQETINAHGTLGTTETCDPTLGNIHTGTLNADCTITMSAPVGSGGATIEWWLTEDGTGGWVPTFAATGGTFTWDGATPTFTTTASTTFRVILERIPGTSNDWVGDLVGGGGGSSLIYAPLTASDGSGGWVLVFTPTGDCIMVP